MRQFTIGFMGKLLLALLFASAAPVFAGEVGGSINASTTWTLENSPYEVIDDITVVRGVTLTIEPGVVVDFMGPYEFRVDGILNASGAYRADHAPDERLFPWNENDISWIRFTQDVSAIDDTMRWRGIRFNESQSGSQLRWAIIENGYARGVWPDNNGGGLFVRAVSVSLESLVIRDCMSDNFGGAAYLWSTASEFQNILITGCYAGNSGGGMYVDQATSITFRNLTMVGNDAAHFGNAIYFGPNTSPVIRSSIFEYNPTANQDDPFDSVNPIDMRYSINSALSDFDLGTQVWPEHSAYFAETEYYTVSDSSRGIDNGAPDDGRWASEPEPNVGPLGDHVNMGVWGGTPFASQTFPVAVAPFGVGANRTRVVPFATTRPGYTNEATMVILNIGPGLLTVRYNQLEWVENSGRFTIPEFETFSLRPDSTGGILALYSPVHGDTQVDTAYVNVVTNGGTIQYLLKGTPIDPVQEVEAPDTLVFGDVYFDSPETLYVKVRNIGTTPLQYLDLDFSSANYGKIVPSHEVAPGDSINLGIIANPKLKGDISGMVTVSSSGGSEQIPVTATAIGPVPYLPERIGSDANVTDNVIDFAFLNVGLEQDRYIEIKNDGNRPLLIGYRSTNLDFLLADTTDGTLVQPDQIKQLAVLFRPTGEERNYLDTLTLVTSDTLTPHKTYSEFLYLLRARSTQGGQFLSGDIPNPDNDIMPVWGPAELGGDGNTRFILAGPTRIPPGETITILPGVEVLFESPDLSAGESTLPAYLEIEGKLEALGTADDPILFAPMDDQLSQDSVRIHLHHGGLRFLASEEGTRLEHVMIDSARTLTIAELKVLLGDNTYVETVPNYLAHGGGISIYNCSPVLEDVVIQNCLSHQDGGGLWIYQSEPTIVRCTIRDNTAQGDDAPGITDGYGGGVVIWGSKPDFFANRVSGNHATAAGGALYLRSLGAGRIANSVFTGNTSSGAGAGAALTGQSNPLILNDVFYDNTADDGTYGLYVSDLSKPVIRSSVIWGVGGQAAIVADQSAFPTVTHSFVQGGYDAGQNIYIGVPEFSSDPDSMFYPADESSNLVDRGADGDEFEDYSFPPSLGSIRGDVGITGGPYAGYLGGAPLRINLFRNPSNARSLKIVVNAVEPILSDPALEISNYAGSDSFDPMPVIDADQRVWGVSYSVESSSVLLLSATAVWKDAGLQEIITTSRRQVTVTIYTQPQGASLASKDGSSFTLPPGGADREMLLFGYGDLSSELPLEAVDWLPAGARYTVDAPVRSFLKAAEVVLPYSRAVVAAGHERGVSIWLFDGDGAWSRLDSQVDPLTGTVRAQSLKAGTFVVLYQSSLKVSTLIPESTELLANYPNPFNPTTTIRFTLRDASRVKLGVYNVLGQRVVVLADGGYAPGAHQVQWDGHDDAGRPVASGVYFYRMETNSSGGPGMVQTRKLVLIR